jgi:E1A/CREB-binding protein
MYNLYSKAGCPSDYPAHTKCVGLFQKIDGVDVLLFAMYVYEYGHDCPAPNRRRVYISYLDSVQYFEPRMFRTVAYQSIITEYLRFVKKRGFHTAHIWSCPPTPGDEYVFYCHPQSQKIPQEEKLRNWYIGILEKAKEDGIVLETTNFYEEYFANSGENAPGATAANPMSLPYFEGDYIPGEIEGILSSLTKEEKRNLPIASALPRRSGSKLGTRSNPGSLLSQTQDKIMLRLGSAIFNMKENLMIVRLRSKSFVAAVERGDDVSGWPEDEESLPLTKGKDSSVLGNVKKEDVDVDAPGDESDPDNSGQLEMALVLSRAFSNTRGPQIGNAVEKDPQFESELFENRQLFLNYCQRNRCQFDDLRKAKHSTMMVLFQLHTPVAPKFLQQCGACHRDIAHGNRFHCNICANYDLCDECYKPVTSGTWAARGARYVHDYSHSFSRISLKETAEAKKSQEERTKSLQGYLEVLAHVANCPGAPSCKLNNCEKMKKLFVHVHTCDLTYLKGCKVCHRLVSLIIIHARSCDVRGSCSLPFCDKIRERNERVRRQQQLMDDRRRQAQNSYYGAGDS